MTVKCSEAQGPSREAREQRIVKSKVIKGCRCKSGECAEKVVELTPGGLHDVLKLRLNCLRGQLNSVQKSAEGVVVARERASAKEGRQRFKRGEGPNGALKRA